MRGVLMAWAGSTGVAVGVGVAQATDPISGGAGWVGAGLLGLVLSWIFFFHLPAKDKQLKELLDGRDANLTALAEGHAKVMREVVEHCQQDDRARAEAFERRHAEQLTLLRQIHESAREAVHATRNLHEAIKGRTRLADAMQSMETPAWTKSLDGTLMSFNSGAERLLGWRPAEVVGRSVYQRIIPPERRAEEERVLSEVGQGRSVPEYETERVNREGRRVRVAVTTSPLTDQTGRVVGATSVAREL